MTKDNALNLMRTSWGSATALALLTFAVYILFSGRLSVPAALVNLIDFESAINTAEDWLKLGIKSYTRAVSGTITGWIERLEYFLWDTPWPIIIAVFALLALHLSGLRLAVFAILGVMVWGMFDMWEAALSTLALILVSVGVCLTLGIPIGVLLSQNKRAEAAIRPILDAMQTVPAFVYLIPFIAFFGIGEAGACITIIIYAMPPVIRLTALGLQQVPANAIEVAESYGTNWWQTLWKVRLPFATPSVIVGVNQTMIMALGMVIIAAFVGVGGLSAETYRPISKLKIGWALEAGISIVIMAILLDRIISSIGKEKAGMQEDRDKTQITHRLLPQGWNGFAPARWFELTLDLIWRGVARISAALSVALGLIASVPLRTINPVLAGRFYRACVHRVFLIGAAGFIVLLYLWDAWVGFGSFPEALQASWRKPVDEWALWVTGLPAVYNTTGFIRDFLYLWVLNPIDQFLLGLPWFFVIGLVTLIAYRAAGAGLALAVVAMLMFTATAGLWELTMLTLSSTFAAVMISVLVGIPLGIWAAQNRTVDRILSPVLDTMQTMPAFVYMIPVIMVFSAGKVPSLIAVIIYALPPVIRLTALGLKQLPEQIDEVCESYGTTPFQSMVKIKLPMASPTIILGINQSAVLALAMQALTPFIAGKGLGEQIYTSMALANTGGGLPAGVAIAMLAIILDRLTSAWNANQREALGLS